MSAAALAAALREAGLPCDVEARDRLAVLTPTTAVSFADDGVRREAIALARAHGFTHLAVELVADGADAALSRD